MPTMGVRFDDVLAELAELVADLFKRFFETGVLHRRLLAFEEAANVFRRGHARGDVVEVQEEPFEAYNARVDAEHAQLVWTHPGVNNWYRNKAGRVVTNSPWRLSHYRNLTAEFKPEDYAFTQATDKAEA